MKIRMIPENKLYAGTPADIVKKLSADAVFLKHRTSREYLRAVALRLPSLKTKGRTHEEKCKDFLLNMIALGMAKLVSK